MKDNYHAHPKPATILLVAGFLFAGGVTVALSVQRCRLVIESRTLPVGFLSHSKYVIQWTTLSSPKFPQAIFKEAHKHV